MFYTLLCRAKQSLYFFPVFPPPLRKTEKKFAVTDRDSPDLPAGRSWKRDASLHYIAVTERILQYLEVPERIFYYLAVSEYIAQYLEVLESILQLYQST